MSKVKNVIVCGKSAEILAEARAAMAPEYDYLHCILNVTQGVDELPILITGQAPPRRAAQNIGSGDYTNPAIAIIIGGGFSQAEFEQLRHSCEGKSNVPWLYADTSPEVMKEMPPLGPGFGKAIVKRIKKRLGEMENEGVMGKDGVYFY